MDLWNTHSRLVLLNRVIWIISINSPMTGFIVSGEWRWNSRDYKYLNLELQRFLVATLCASIHNEMIHSRRRLVKTKHPQINWSPWTKASSPREPNLNYSIRSLSQSRIVLTLVAERTQCWGISRKLYVTFSSPTPCSDGKFDSWSFAVGSWILVVEKVLVLSLCMCVINYYDHVITVNIVHIYRMFG